MIHIIYEFIINLCQKFMEILGIKYRVIACQGLEHLQT